MNRALFDRNADACENATRDRCTCHCGGELHGARHSEQWRSETFQRLSPEPRVDRRTRDLFDEARP